MLLRWAHDSHNIIAVGADDASLCKAINLIIEQRGGVFCCGEGQGNGDTLPVAGLMSDQDGYEVARAYAAIDKFSAELEVRLPRRL